MLLARAPPELAQRSHMASRRRDDSIGTRHARLHELILEELRSILRDDIDDPRLETVRITALVLASDLRSARVHYAANARTTSEPVLARATPFLRAKLAEALDLKRVPELRFVFDTELE